MTSAMIADDGSMEVKRVGRVFSESNELVVPSQTTSSRNGSVDVGVKKKHGPSKPVALPLSSLSSKESIMSLSLKQTGPLSSSPGSVGLAKKYNLPSPTVPLRFTSSALDEDDIDPSESFEPEREDSPGFLSGVSNVDGVSETTLPALQPVLAKLRLRESPSACSSGSLHNTLRSSDSGSLSRLSKSCTVEDLTRLRNEVIESDARAELINWKESRRKHDCAQQPAKIDI
mmetsp:Transcript_3533/g.7679  ORF Transcript_3533/g.7679 Transcript_3533/m.7679 type:complete len:230 (-) Transcript_3533:932-1621(-)